MCSFSCSCASWLILVCVLLDDCSKNRDSVPDLAPVLWFSYGTMAALLEEIVCVASFLMPVNGDARCRVVGVAWPVLNVCQFFESASYPAIIITIIIIMSSRMLTNTNMIYHPRISGPFIPLCHPPNSRGTRPTEFAMHLHCCNASHPTRSHGRCSCTVIPRLFLSTATTSHPWGLRQTTSELTISAVHTTATFTFTFACSYTIALSTLCSLSMSSSFHIICEGCSVYQNGTQHSHAHRLLLFNFFDFRAHAPVPVPLLEHEQQGQGF